MSQPPPSAPPPSGPPPNLPPQSPPGWGGPPPGAIYPGASTTTQVSGLAVASLVTGLFFWCCAVPGIVSIVLGHLALEDIENSGGAKRGRGMAIAGIVLGWVGIGIVGVLVVWWFVTVLTI